MNLGRVSSAALMASGLAGVVMPGRVGTTAVEIGLVGAALLGARAARGRR